MLEMFMAAVFFCVTEPTDVSDCGHAFSRSVYSTEELCLNALYTQMAPRIMAQGVVPYDMQCISLTPPIPVGEPT